MKKLVVALSLLVSLAVAAPAMATHAWGTYHWALTDTTNFTVALGDNVNSTWDPYLVTASSQTDWSNPVAANPVRTAITGGTTDPKKCRARSGRVEVCNATYGRNGWLGLAQIWLSGGHITQGTAKMNDSYFNMAAYSSPAHRRLVMCQEVGHTFGLGHQDENHSNPNLGTCMDYTNAPAGGGSYDLSNEHPNQHDYDQLDSIYNHWDASTTLATSTQASRGEAPYHTRRHDTPGHTEIVEHFSDGSAKVTDILWADR